MNSTIHFEAEPGARADAPPLRVPKGALVMAAAMIVVVFALAASARLFGFGAFRERTGVAIVDQRSLRFEDLATGGIRVSDAATGRVAAELPAGSNGFLRGALRSLTRARRADGIGDAQAFRLVRYADGRLVLHDPATEHRVTVTSFGTTQIAAFDRLLR